MSQETPLKSCIYRTRNRKRVNDKISGRNPGCCRRRQVQVAVQVDVQLQIHIFYGHDGMITAIPWTQAKPSVLLYIAGNETRTVHHSNNTAAAAAAATRQTEVKRPGQPHESRIQQARHRWKQVRGDTGSPYHYSILLAAGRSSHLHGRITGFPTALAKRPCI